MVDKLMGDIFLRLPAIAKQGKITKLIGAINHVYSILSK